MSNVWFSSDLHFGHENVIKYSNRPFSSVEEMNEGLIQNHNSLVKPGDTYYHLGDFAFAPQEFIQKTLRRMNGNKIFVAGNHDKPKNFTGLVGQFRSDWFGKVGNLRVHMYHYPVEAWNGAYHGTVHLHGHSHGSTDNTGKLRFDVGVDCFNMYPVGLEDLEKLVAKRTEEMKEAGIDFDASRKRTREKRIEASGNSTSTTN